MPQFGVLVRGGAKDGKLKTGGRNCGSGVEKINSTTVLHSPARRAGDLLAGAPGRAHDHHPVVFDIVPAASESASLSLLDPVHSASGADSYLTMSSAILSGNLPTLVPPNFWTTQPRESGFFNRARAISGLLTDSGGLIDSEEHKKSEGRVRDQVRSDRDKTMERIRRPNGGLTMENGGVLLLLVRVERGGMATNAQRGRGCFSRLPQPEIWGRC